MTGKSVLVVAAHPDDEVLGAGGAMARHTQAGDPVSVLILGRGLAAREARPDFAGLEAECRAALAELGVEDVRFEDFPDNAFDTVPLLEVARAVERVASAVKPRRIYTHSATDLNVDHRIANEAVMIAARPLPGASVAEVFAFEVASATHWGNDAFRPTAYIDISASLERKLSALACYASEMRPFPHARCIEAQRAQAAWRGAQVGVAAAEAFETLRIVER